MKYQICRHDSNQVFSFFIMNSSKMILSIHNKRFFETIDELLQTYLKYNDNCWEVSLFKVNDISVF